ncbi:hypothetical protein D3C75_1242330 [compost metagenome]
MLLLPSVLESPPLLALVTVIRSALAMVSIPVPALVSALVLVLALAPESAMASVLVSAQVQPTHFS